jgi:hypothetical protein
MSDSYIPYQDPTTVNRKLDSESITVGANTVERERVQIAGAGDVAIAQVVAENPNSGSWGVIVRNIPTGTETVIVTNVQTGSIQLDPLSHVTITNIKGGTISSLTNGSVQLLTGSQLIGTVAIVPTLMYSVTGATTGAGTTYIQAAVSGKKIKVYAYDIISTVAGGTYFQVKFTDGVTGGAELAVHGLVNATGNCVTGVAKSVTPPAYLFATTAGNTLTLISSAAQPVNYNVSYWTSDAV